MTLAPDPVTRKQKRRSRVVVGDLSAAERKLSQMLLDLHERPDAAPAVSLGTIIDAWLDHVRPDLSPSTLRTYDGYIGHRIRPQIGDVSLNALTVRKLDQFYAGLRGGKRPLSASTIRQIHAILRCALEQAVRWGLLEANPARLATPPPIRRAEVRPPDREVLGRLVDAAFDVGPQLGTLVWLAVVTGARRGELCALRWSDIALDRNELEIRRNLVEAGERRVVEKDTKTHAARFVALDDATVALLKEHRKRALERVLGSGESIAEDPYVFSEAMDSATPLHPGRVSERFRLLCKHAGVKVRFHDLRHFAATEALAAGIPVRDVAGRLGHANAATTLGVYAHARKERDRATANVLGVVLEGATTQGR